MIRMIFLCILTEALVELIFTAAPLQGARAWLIKKTPFLVSIEQGHLLECKYCTSLWIAAAVITMATYADYPATRLASAALVISRLSNYAHILIGWIRDVQINKRLERK